MTDYRYLHLVRQDCPLPPGTHVVVYCRDSGGDEQDRSVEQQIEAAREYCQHYGLVLENAYIDEAVQSTALHQRHAFNAMMQDIRERFPVIDNPIRREKRSREKPFGVICWKSNRLGRDTIHTRHVKADMRLRGLTIVSLIALVETGVPAIDSLIESLYELQDEQLLKEISDNAKRGLTNIVTMRDNHPDFRAFNPDWPETGAYLGVLPGQPPRGFAGERICIGLHKRKHTPRIVQRIVPDPATWDTCLRAWEMRREGASYYEIHNALHIYKQVGSYNTFFSNRIYAGDLIYSGQILKNFVPSMVPLEWWEEENSKIAERSRRYHGAAVAPEFEPRRVWSRQLLSGLLYCAHVDGELHIMSADSKPPRGTRNRWRFYICSVKKKSRDRDCQALRVNAVAIEQAVVNALLKDVLTMDTMRPLINDLKAKREDTSAAKQLQLARKELAKVEKALVNLIDAVEAVGLSSSLKEKLKEREADKARLLMNIEQLERNAMRPASSQVTDEMIGRWLQDMLNAVADDTLKYHAIRYFIRRITLKNKVVEIDYTVPALTQNAGIGRGMEILRPEGKNVFPLPIIHEAPTRILQVQLG